MAGILSQGDLLLAFSEAGCTTVVCGFTRLEAFRGDPADPDSMSLVRAWSRDGLSWRLETRHAGERAQAIDVRSLPQVIGYLTSAFRRSDTAARPPL